jgi:calnexin
MVLTRPARRYAVTSPFLKQIDLSDDLPLIIQYEVQLQEGLTCGGAYVKVYEATSDFDPVKVSPNTPYSIMFGPDRCGSTDKVHFIIRWKNPVTGLVEEKHATRSPAAKSDKLSHLYTLIIRPDTTFVIKIDGKVEREGKLGVSDEFSPSILPSLEIDDPTDVKPADWVDDKEIADPDATKPNDWDENQPSTIPDESAEKPFGWLDNEPDIIPDPSAKQPEDWDEDEDGKWEAPLVSNPKCEAAVGCGKWTRPTKSNPLYKGKWRAPMIANPLFKGIWAPRKITNPAFFEDVHLNRLSGAKMAALGVEVWTMNGGITFDNFLVTRSEDEAEIFSKETFTDKQRAQEAALKIAEQAAERERLAKAAENGGILERVMVYFNEALFLAQNNPTSAIFVLLITLLTLGGLCATVCCAPEAEMTHSVPRKSSSKHSDSHTHSHSGSHSHSHGGHNVEEDDEDDEEEDGDKSRNIDEIAAKFATKHKQLSKDDKMTKEKSLDDGDEKLEDDKNTSSSAIASNSSASNENINTDELNDKEVEQVTTVLPPVESAVNKHETKPKPELQTKVEENTETLLTSSASTSNTTSSANSTSPTAATTRQRKNRPQA